MTSCYNCGNGVVELPEVCDDGNNLDFDGCSASCMVQDLTPPSINFELDSIVLLKFCSI